MEFLRIFTKYFALFFLGVIFTTFISSFVLMITNSLNVGVITWIITTLWYIAHVVFPKEGW